MVARARISNDQRLRSLQKLKEDGLIYWVTSMSDNGTTVNFHVKVTPTADTKVYTGTQVDAFLFGIRVGRANPPMKITTPADSPQVPTSQKGN